ncbi:toll/interleukin-1 receptor domain-containing protein [Actinocorallia longicatena]|uniref:TIR domain-containing protein n=1 Tax=Actinocorallia longicatena TaxID=111803 RepID=A0ABP6Q5I5_9ACTN
MAAIFINYRVGETAQIARLLYERLARIFGPGEVFFASENLLPGHRFDVPILDAVRSSEVLLAVIGPHWQDAPDASGSPRLHAEDDWVRREITEALALSIPVIPVLVDGAPSPHPDSLPPDLRPLPDLHHVRLGHRSGDPGVDVLAAAIRRTVPRLNTIPTSPPPTFTVHAPGSKGLQTGDGNTQHNTFT